MSILVIDNGSRSIEQLLGLLTQWSPAVQAYGSLDLKSIKAYSGIVLSGGHGPSVQWNPEAYSQEIDLLRTSLLPIIGICLGCELIGRAFGARLRQLPEREHKKIEVQVTQPDSIFSGPVFTAAENHRWIIDSPGSELLPLAASIDGVEIVKHVTRPIYGFQFHPELAGLKAEARNIVLRAAAQIGF